MPAPSTYSLSSGFRDASGSTTSKKKRLSAQFVGSFMASKSWASSSASNCAGSQPRRPGRLSDLDGRYMPRAQRRSTSNIISDDNVLSKAAAWTWHARSSSEITVSPTKLQRSVQEVEASLKAPSSKRQESGEPHATDQISSTNRQLSSRFKPETHNFLSASARPADPDDVDDQLHISLPSNNACQSHLPASEPAASASDLPEGDHDDGKQPSNFLYDQHDLLSLQREVEKLRCAQQRLVSDHGMIHNYTPAQFQAACSTSSPFRKIKLLSGIQRLFSKLHTSALHSKSGPSGSGGAGPRKADLGTAQHVIHHHHHHFHYHNLALPAPPSDNYGHEVVARRRRANSESCSEAQLQGSIGAAVIHPEYAGADEHDKDEGNDNQKKKGGDGQIHTRAGCTGPSVRRHSHSFSASSTQLRPILE